MNEWVVGVIAGLTALLLKDIYVVGIRYIIWKLSEGKLKDFLTYFYLKK